MSRAIASSLTQAIRRYRLEAAARPVREGKGRSMRPVIGFFLFSWSVAAQAQPYFQPPTATELFNLRSQCAALGNKFLDDLFAASKSVTSHYDPRTNHCYGDVVTQSPAVPSYSNRSLFDLQTGELLAFAKTEKGKKVGMVFSRLSDMRDDVGFSDANEYIDKIVQEDR
jgi:hypothetical protein